MPDELKKFKVEDEETGEEIETVPASAVEDLKKQLAEKEAALAKEREKEKNFEALRKSKEKEEEEKSTLSSRLEALEREREESKKMFEENRKKSLEIKIKEYARGDKDMEDKITFHLSRYKDEALSAEELEERVKDAHFLASRRPDGGSALNRATSAFGSATINPSKGEDFADTPEGRAFAEALGMQFVNKKKQ